MSSCRSILFWQKPFTSSTEQIGCYYFNILSVALKTRELGVQLVPPLLPLAPRDNAKVESDPSKPWDSSILEFGSISSDKVLRYTDEIPIMEFEEFISLSNLKVRMPWKILEFRGFTFYQDNTSEFWILELPPRWDTLGNDPQIFFNQLYPMLPLREEPLQLSPEWFRENSKRTFLGVHWRRGDRGNFTLGGIGIRLWRSSEPKIVANHINKYLQRNPEIEWVYISTNSGSEKDRDVLRSLVNKPLYYFDRPQGIEHLSIWKYDLCDLLQCAQAKHLLLSPGGFSHSSAFSRLILAQCYQNNPTDALVTFMPLI